MYIYLFLNSKNIWLNSYFYIFYLWFPLSLFKVCACHNILIVISTVKISSPVFILWQYGNSPHEQLTALFPPIPFQISWSLLHHPMFNYVTLFIFSSVFFLLIMVSSCYIVKQSKKIIIYNVYNYFKELVASNHNAKTRDIVMQT